VWGDLALSASLVSNASITAPSFFGLLHKKFPILCPHYLVRVFLSRSTITYLLSVLRQNCSVFLFTNVNISATPSLTPKSGGKWFVPAFSPPDIRQH
jgi:hypothetical protein